jgi:hypothetical protein
VTNISKNGVQAKEFWLLSDYFLSNPKQMNSFASRLQKSTPAQVAELVDALVSNTCGKPYRFDSGPGYNA